MRCKHGYRIWKLLALSVCVSCSGSSGKAPAVAGVWSGNVRPAHFDYLEVDIRQEGLVLHGTACMENVTVPSPGGVHFDDGVVTGLYPTIHIASRRHDWAFQGEFQEDGTVNGRYSTTNLTDYPMSLVRGMTGGGTGCLRR